MMKEWEELEEELDSTNMKDYIESQGESLKLTLTKEGSSIREAASELEECSRFIVVGAGDKYLIPMITEYMWHYISTKPFKVIHSRVFVRYMPPLTSDTCVIFLSQSGVTKDTVDALKASLRSEAKLIAITNLKEELRRDNVVTLLKDRGRVLRTHTKFYPERPLPATATFHTTLLVLNLLVLCLNPGPRSSRLFNLLMKSIDAVGELSVSQMVKEWARKASLALFVNNQDDFLYVVGGGPRYPVARKHARIMLMEGVKVDAASVEAEEFVHSLIGTLGPENKRKKPLILLKPLDEWGEEASRLVRELWRRYAGEERLIEVNPFEFLSSGSEAFRSLEGDLISPFLYVVPLEWQAYYLALLRGVDPGRSELVNKVRDGDELAGLSRR